MNTKHVHRWAWTSTHEYLCIDCNQKATYDPDTGLIEEADE